MLLFAPALAAESICGSWGAQEVVTFEGVENPVPQASGLIRGVDTGTFLTAGDAGTENHLTAFSTDGSVRYTQTLTNATNTDWEDLALGPCPEAVSGTECVYVGDIGDNESTRAYISLWVYARTTDPEVTAVQCPLQYEDGVARDAEGLFVTPDGVVRVVTKEPDAKVFRVRELTCDGVPQTMIREAELLLDDDATGAAASPDGSQVVIRSRSTAYVWEGSCIEWGATPVELAMPTNEVKGEAITFAEDGSIVTTTERPVVDPSDPIPPFVLNILPCEDTHEAPPPCVCACGTAHTPAWGLGTIVGLLALRRRHRTLGL